MQKLRLKIEDLGVESFQTGDKKPVAGTVAAHQQQEVVDSAVSNCTCTDTTDTAWFSLGCAEATYDTAHWRFC